MVVASAEIIMFGIQAGVRLFGASRQAYVDKTKERNLTLPLPGLDHDRTAGDAWQYFASNPNGVRHLAASERLQELHAAAGADLVAFERDEPSAAEYLHAYDYFRALASGQKEQGYDANEVLAITTIAQWREGKAPHPTALQRIGGTLVEVGIDYFADGPGKSRLSGDGAGRRLLREVLVALDDRSFVTEGLDGVVETVFLNVLDAIAEDSSLVADDAKVRQFVGAVSRGVVADVRDRLERMDEHERFFEGGRLAESAGLVLRSVVRHGAGHALANPGALLSVDGEAEGALIARVGTAVLDTILPRDGDDFDLRAVLSADGVDRIVRAGLAVAAEHPELLGLDDGESGLQKMLHEVAGKLLATTETLGPDMLPELMRLILERTSGNLHLMWDADSDEEHLLVSGVAALLESLSEPVADGERWSLAFSRATLLDVAEQLIDEVAANPAMVTERIGAKLPVKVAIEAALAELAELRLAEVSSASLAHVLKVSVRAAASRMDFLDRFKVDDGPLKTATGHVLAAVLDAAFPEDGVHARSSWMLAQQSVLEAVTEIVFEELTEVGVDAGRVRALRAVLADVVATIEDKQRFSLGDFTDRLADALAAA